MLMTSSPPPALIVRTAPAVTVRGWVPATLVLKSAGLAKFGSKLNRLWISRPALGPLVAIVIVSVSPPSLPFNTADKPEIVAVYAAWADWGQAISAPSRARA